MSSSSPISSSPTALSARVTHSSPKELAGELRVPQGQHRDSQADHRSPTNSGASSSRSSRPTRPSTALSPRTLSFTPRASPSSVKMRKAISQMSATTTLVAAASKWLKSVSSLSCRCATLSSSNPSASSLRAVFSCLDLREPERRLWLVPSPTKPALSSS